jgi:hypothetical protein
VLRGLGPYLSANVAAINVLSCYFYGSNVGGYLHLVCFGLHLSLVFFPPGGGGGGAGGWKHPQAIFLPLGVGPPLLHFNVAQAAHKLQIRGSGPWAIQPPLQNSGDRGANTK